MPILRSHAAWFHKQRIISSVTFTSAHLYGNVYIPVGVPRIPACWPIRPIWGFWGESSQKWEIPCLGCRWTTMQNLTLLALSSAEKSVTVQTVNDISTPCLSACVDNKWRSKRYPRQPVMEVTDYHKVPQQKVCSA